MSETEAVASRAVELYEAERERIVRRTDRLFAWLMGGQWLFVIGIALAFSLHVHLFLVLFLGVAILLLPILAWMRMQGLRDLRMACRRQAQIEALSAGAEQKRIQIEELNAELELRVVARTEDLRGAYQDLETSFSKLRQTQDQLILADRMVAVGRLSAGVAHEINNPLAFVASNLNFAAEEIDELRSQLLPGAAEGARDRIAEVQTALAEATHGAERVGRIVQDLKTVSRSSPDSREPLDVNAILESSIKIASNEIRHRATLVQQLGSLPTVIGDPGRLGQVFLNLIINAAQAIVAGRVDENAISVRTRVEGNFAVVEVADTGAGIPPEIRDKLFDPFFTTKPVGVGTGLGLSICHGIVSALGGKIEVESKVGNGSLFRVLLPAAADDRVRLVPVLCEVEHTRSARVLAIDDEPMVLSVLRRTLRRHDVVTASSGKEALALINAGERFDLILCDLMMPAMTGMELHGELARVAPEHARRMIFFTGGAFTPAARAFLERNGNTCLEKPFEARSIEALLQRESPAPDGGTPGRVASHG